MRKKYFRADRRCFEPGQVMVPEGTYQDQFKTPGLLMEEALEKGRPKDTKPNRKDALFVFEDMQEVERYWRTHDGSFLYEVEIDESKVMHRGDMNFTDEIGLEFRRPHDDTDLNKVSELVGRYLNGDLSGDAVVELLMDGARVVAKLKGRSDLKEWVRKNVKGYNPKDDPSIEEMLGLELDDKKDDTSSK